MECENQTTNESTDSISDGESIFNSNPELRYLSAFHPVICVTVYSFLSVKTLVTRIAVLSKRERKLVNLTTVFQTSQNSKLDNSEKEN